MHKIKVNKLLKLDGEQQYAPVKERILALRDSDHRYSLETDITFIEKANGWLAKTKLTILDTGEFYTGSSFVREGRGNFIQRNFPVEDAETSAIGRAFAAAGIGIDEAFASYEEMKRSRELAKDKTEAKVGEALDNLAKVVERKSAHNGDGETPACDIPSVQDLHDSSMLEAASDLEKQELEKVDDVEWVEVHREAKTKPSDEPKLAEISTPTREEIVAPDSPLVTGDWDKKPATAVRKEVNKEIATKAVATRSPQTVEEITGKGVTEHMKEVFVRLMEHGVNPFDYPERNTDKKFDAIEAAWNRGQEEFVAFIKQEWGIKYTSIHRKDVVEQDTFKEKKPFLLDNGKTIAQTIDDMNKPYQKKEEPKVQLKQDEETVMPEPLATVGEVKPNNDFLNQGKGGTMAQNFDNTGNKFGFKIMPLEERSKPSLFTKWVVELVKKGVDIEMYETYFTKHHLSNNYPSFEALLRTGSEEHINEFLNRH